MKLFLVLSSLCAVALCSPLEGWHRIETPLQDLRVQKILKNVYSKQNFESDPLRGGRIVGGALAARNQFPYQTFEIFDGSWVCGGSIISETRVLTAAHCVDGMTSAQVVAGEINLGATFPWGVSGVTTFYKHEGYNSYTIANDIALIPVPTIPLGPSLGIVLLPSQDDDSVVLDSLTGTVSGFGRFADNVADISNDLRYVSVQFYPNSQCALVYGSNVVTDNNVCTYGGNGQGTCGGDSGGPLTAIVNERSVQVGIVSFGAAAGCQLGYPAAYTRVTRFLGWLSTNGVATS